MVDSIEYCRLLSNRLRIVVIENQVCFEDLDCDNNEKVFRIH
jgi:hypothetical protein